MDTRSFSKEDQLIEYVDRAMMGLSTSIPAVVVSFDKITQTVQAQPAIKARVFVKGVETFIDHGVIVEVPIVIYRGGGFALTTPIVPGDECLLVFSQRAIDNWHEFSGTQPPENGAKTARHHDMTDAIAIFSPVSLPKVLTSYTDDGIELRNESKTSRVTLKDSTIEIAAGTTTITVNADGTLTITASSAASLTAPAINLTGVVGINGALNVTGNITSTGGAVSDSTGTMAAVRSVFNTHTHNETGTTTAVPNQTM